MTTNYHTDHVVGAPLTAAEVNAPLGELDAQVSRLSGMRVNVEDYGADVGSDSTAAIQAAITANPHATIYFPHLYPISASLTFAGEGQRFEGVAPSSFDDGYVNSGVTGTVAGPLLKGPGGVGRYNGLHIEGLGFINLSTNAAAVGVDLSQTSRARIINCVIRGASGAATGSRLPVGLKLEGPAYFTYVQGNRFAWCARAININTGGPFGGITGEPNASSFLGNSMSACDYGIFSFAGIGISFVGNTIDAYEAVGIRADGVASRGFYAGNYVEMRPGAAGSPANIWVVTSTAADNMFLGTCHAGSGTPFLDTAGARTMFWDYVEPLATDDNGMSMREGTAPGSTAANEGKLFLVDNGSGKTVLKVIFNTGAAITIATQP